MFNSPVLDLVILLSFIYFIGSLILSTVNESISAFFNSRPKQLKESMQTLLFDNDGKWKEWIDGDFINNPNIQALMKVNGKYPSYIPAGNFVLAVITQLRTGGLAPNGDIQQAINNSGLPPVFQKVLSDLALQVNGDFMEFQKKLEGFYNCAMDRVGGVYKKNIRRWLLGIGFAMAVMLNLDTIQIIQDELQQPTRLSETVDKIAHELPQIQLNKDQLETVSIKTANGVITVDRQVDSTKNLATAVKPVSELTLYLGQTSGYTMGYSAKGGFLKQWSGAGFLKKLLGVLITAFALQLSAGFWFDLMSKAVNIRAAGNKPKTEAAKK